MAPDLSPNLPSSLISVASVLPFISPAHKSVLMSAHSPDVAQNRPECSFWYKQPIQGGSEGSTESRTGLDEPSRLDERCHMEGQPASLQNALHTLMLSLRLHNPHLEEKNPASKYN